MNQLFSGWSNLQQRILVGVLGIGLFLGLIFWGMQGTLFLFAILIALCLDEFYGLSPYPLTMIWRIFGVWTGLILFGIYLIRLTPGDHFSLRWLIILPAMVLIFLVFYQGNKPFETTSWMVFGWFYLLLPWIALLETIAPFQYRPEILLGLFFLLWAADSGAYFAGKALGKTKLLPRVSPKKTWEGLIGGVLLSMVTGWIFWFLAGGFTLSQWMILGCSTTIFGTLGDLAESVLKRSLNLKDSGNLLPGHGGILDRFDGLFVAAPANAFIIYTFFEIGG